MDGWMDGQTDRQRNGWTDGWMSERKSSCVLQDFVPFGAAALLHPHLTYSYKAGQWEPRTTYCPWATGFLSFLPFLLLFPQFLVPSFFPFSLLLSLLHLVFSLFSLAFLQPLVASCERRSRARVLYRILLKAAAVIICEVKPMEVANVIPYNRLLSEYLSSKRPTGFGCKTQVRISHLKK